MEDAREVPQVIESPKEAYLRKMPLCRSRHPKWVSNFEELVLTQASKVCSPVSVRGVSTKTLLTRCIF